MVGLKPVLEMVSFSSYDFLYVLKFQFFAFYMQFETTSNLDGFMIIGAGSCVTNAFFMESLL